MSRPRVARLALVLAYVVHTGVLSSVVAQAPRGPEIAFSSGRAGGNEIYVMGPDGGGVRALTQLRGRAFRPRWAPDGRKIVFSWGPLRDPGERTIYVMRADGTQATKLTRERDTHDSSVTWSPDGRHIAFASERPRVDGTHIYVMDADGRNVRRLTLDWPFEGAYSTSPSWSPNGAEIAFTSWGPRTGTAEVFAIRPHSRRVRQITNDGMWNRSARWSPDGRELILESSPNARKQDTDIYVVDSDGRNRARLVEHPHRDQSPAWSPDGSRVVFHRFFWVDSDVYVVDRGGGPARNLTRHPSRDWAGDWFDPAALAVSDVGKRLVPWGWLKAPVWRPRIHP
ncbi:hypothetical protein CMK11_08120 [Candidatus Poribacteria bacterium]|nr:hypothetical protein [Candidatus Poribacteria bacterium]